MCGQHSRCPQSTVHVSGLAGVALLPVDNFLQWKSQMLPNVQHFEPNPPIVAVNPLLALLPPSGKLLYREPRWLIHT
jgi:hypothetical protein